MVKKLKNVDLIEENQAYLKILNWFFSFPNMEVSLNDLSQQLRISKTTANKIVSELERKGFLKKEVLGRIWRISCNQNHPYNFTRKIAYNLSWVYESVIINLTKEIVLKDRGITPRAIILFGSYRKGDDTEKSDIDIAVEVLDNKDTQVIQLGVLPQFGYRTKVPINLHIFSRNKIDLNLFANIANGIVLEGFLEVRP
ncbi:MAG: nucleotidyltransferase domain-containing protein [Nanoarchaeota archaeon]